MAQAIETGKAGGKRSLNVDVNLVPFIDLLSVLICFLLIAAVWLQLGSVDIKQAYGTGGSDEKSEKFEIQVTLIDARSLSIDILQSGRKKGSTSVMLQPEQKLFDVLTPELHGMIRNASGTADVPFSELVESAMIVPAKAAPYSQLVSVMDVLRKSGIVNLAVNPKAG